MTASSSWGRYETRRKARQNDWTAASLVLGTFGFFEKKATRQKLKKPDQVTPKLLSSLETRCECCAAPEGRRARHVRSDALHFFHDGGAAPWESETEWELVVDDLSFHRTFCKEAGLVT